MSDNSKKLSNPAQIEAVSAKAYILREHLVSSCKKAI